ncbi:hypothetical protein [Albibacterium bauzanense]|uniref:Uncharacterized protein n=1 Tax=Albibacterium bauzanense TaxID=653929 RepID=A0A4R1M6W2_9SPHI|nr:hypothetical protein [Albibacterium bauzanense]TCK85529.1 hypothetical protein C8N28_0838 [Albibacterium bauzanense]
MNKIIVPSKLDDKVLEGLFLTFVNTPKDLDLELPLEINYRGFGILPKLFLVIFTWVRNKNGKLIIPIDINNESTLSEFAQSYFGYIVLLTVWKDCDIENPLGESLKRALRPYTSQFHNKIDFLKGLPNDAILIPNFDHYSKSQGYSHWFYTLNYDFFEVPSALNNTVYRVFECLSINLKSKIINSNSGIIEDLQSILWELMRNTHEHAIKDHLNQINISPNTRGAYFRIQRSSKRNFIKEAKSHKGLISYYENALEEGDNFMLEVSVFDSGPGLVKRFLGAKWEDNLNIRDDVNTIKQCLIKGQTSVVTSKGLSKGFGLDHVLKLLSKKHGFLKIRTGRASLYRDLIKAPYFKTQDLSEVVLNDWINSSNSSYVNMNNTEGAMITMVYPINEIK